MEAMGLKPPAHFDGRTLMPLLRREQVKWRDYFLYVYYWEHNYPQSPTMFALRGDRYKLITYYGIWDVDELYDLQNDPNETHNLRYDPAQKDRVAEMTRTLFKMMDELGGMQIPLNPPSGEIANLRYRSRGGQEAADFPQPLITDQPTRRGGDH
jgi:N-acetylglucosamine-6-sulfatase